MPASVQHAAAAHRFTLATDAGDAVLEYTLDGDTATFTHTGVPEAAEGQGVGSALVRGALDAAREKGWTVVPQCPFVASYVERHPDAGKGLVA